MGTILGSRCFSAPSSFSPPGACTDTGDILICYADEDEFPILISWYDPNIETDNPAVADYQCMEPCDQLGDGTPVAEGYGRFMACVSGWYWRRIEFPDIGETRQCRDHGGAIELTCGDRGNGYACWIPVDFLERERPWYAHSAQPWRVVDDNGQKT